MKNEDMALKPARFLDPKSDLVFKKIFGQHPNLMKSLLNGILPLPKDQVIEKIEYLNPEQVPVIPTMKNTVVDVKCTDQLGRVFIVEMRVLQQKQDVERILSHPEYGSYVKDEGRPFKIGFQEQILNYLKLLWAKFKVVSVKEKAWIKLGQVSI